MRGAVRWPSLALHTCRLAGGSRSLWAALPPQGPGVVSLEPFLRGLARIRCRFCGHGPVQLIGHAVDRKSVVYGKSVSVRVDLGGRRIIKKKNEIYNITI